jgi:hypothetical protein
MGARRLREAIFAILPPWLIEEAKDLCSATLAGGDSGQTLQQRIANLVEIFSTRHGITVDQLEQKLARASRLWTDYDIAQLMVIGKSIDRGETTRDEEFPPAMVTVAEITAQAQAADKRESVVTELSGETITASPVPDEQQKPDDENPDEATRKAVADRLTRQSKKTAADTTGASGEDWPDTAQPPDAKGSQ